MFGRRNDRRVNRVGVNDTTNLWVGSIHLTMNGELVVAWPFAGNLVAFEIDENEIVFGHFFKSKARTLYPILAWCVSERRGVTVNEVLVPLHSENAAG